MNRPDEPADRPDVPVEDVVTLLSKLDPNVITSEDAPTKRLEPSEWWCQTHRVRSTDGPCCSLAAVVAQTLRTIQEAPPST